MKKQKKSKRMKIIKQKIENCPPRAYNLKFLKQKKFYLFF